MYVNVQMTTIIKAASFFKNEGSWQALRGQPRLGLENSQGE
jgi:hypothetical protein